MEQVGALLAPEEVRMIPVDEHKNALQYLQRLLAIDEQLLADLTHKQLRHCLLTRLVMKQCDCGNGLHQEGRLVRDMVRHLVIRNDQEGHTRSHQSAVSIIQNLCFVVGEYSAHVRSVDLGTRMSMQGGPTLTSPSESLFSTWYIEVEAVFHRLFGLSIDSLAATLADAARAGRRRLAIFIAILLLGRLLGGQGVDEVLKFVL